MGFARSVLVAFAMGVALPATAQEVVPATELETLLSGNTIFGTWSGNEYTQYFREDGMTVYIPTGRQPDIGKWRVNPDTDQYESWWEQSGWARYTVIRTEDGYTWKREAGSEPFTVQSGKHITW